MQRPVLNRLLVLLLQHLYGDMACMYDLTAFTVSLGRWNDWVRSVTPDVRGPRVLELGHGPGHLQHHLRTMGFGLLVGLDASAQMGILARRRLQKPGGIIPNLTRAVARCLPFGDAMFETLVATFPAEFILDSACLSEARRVLVSRGRIVVLPAAWILGRTLLDRGAAWLFRVTHEAPTLGSATIEGRLRLALENAGLHVVIRSVEFKSSVVLIVIASK